MPPSNTTYNKAGRMSIAAVLLPLVLLLIHPFGQVQAFPLNETSYLNVYMPSYLHKMPAGQYGIRHTMSNFGRHPEYGSMMLPVYFYFEICNLPIDTSAGYPPRGKDAKGHQLRWEPPFMLMVPRGGCSFTTKARHAQIAGASAILIADTTCLCSDEVCMKNITWKDPGTCQEYEPPMADDGSGGDVTIPGFLLRKDEAYPITDAIIGKHQSVVMGIRWHRPQNDSVHFGAWLDIMDDRSKVLLQQIGTIANGLGDRGHFYPHFMVTNGTRANCGGAGDNSTEGLCYNMCTNNGRYCYPTHHYNGTAIVVEILRRKCIWKHHGPVQGDIGSSWWDYITYFDKNCQEITGDEKCPDEALADAGIDKKEIEVCMSDSGDPTQDTPNNLLEEELRAQAEWGTTIAPTVWANHRVLRASSQSATDLFREICDLNRPDNKFEICKQCLKDDDQIGCVAKKFGGPPQHHSNKKFHFWLWTGLLGSLVFFGYAYKRYQEGEGAGFPVPTLQYSMLRDQDNPGFESS